MVDAFQSLGDPLPLEDGSDCFAAQLPRVLIRILRALLPLVAAHPPSRQQTPRYAMQTPTGSGVERVAAATAVTAVRAEERLGESLYDLSASTLELLATLGAHGSAAEVRAVGLDGVDRRDGTSPQAGRRSRGNAGGSRWVKEITVGVGGADGGGGSGWGGGGGRNVEILEACWAVSRDVDGVRGECHRGMGDGDILEGAFSNRGVDGVCGTSKKVAAMLRCSLVGHGRLSSICRPLA